MLVLPAIVAQAVKVREAAQIRTRFLSNIQSPLEASAYNPLVGFSIKKACAVTATKSAKSQRWSAAGRQIQRPYLAHPRLTGIVMDLLIKSGAS
jgi:hypothetical protein